MINDIANFFESIFSPVVSILGYVLEFFHGLGLEWWLSIAALTIVVRMILFPLTIKQVRSMRAMQELRPELDKIRGQYSNNRQRQQEEMMKLYQERSINPLGGCLPILVQMPIFIGIFYVIRQFGGYGDVEGTKPTFQDGGILWFTNLSEMDPFLILPIVSALTMLAATEITAKNLEPQQRWIMRILPIGITFFLWSFPAGLFVYWITSNVVTFVQNYAIYNYGPGKKTATTEPSKQESGSQSGGNGSEKPSTNGSADPSAHAAKVAKRKRRKKKK
ncbi:MAG: membrane protein insertase YidC [Actinomycetota bacterium]|nr:membrane protein insertase YidC [Actinomycetota bacterium]